MLSSITMPLDRRVWFCSIVSLSYVEGVSRDDTLPASMRALRGMMSRVPRTPTPTLGSQGGDPGSDSYATHGSSTLPSNPMSLPSIWTAERLMPAAANHQQ